MKENEFRLEGLFPAPLYSANLESGLDPAEENEIKDIIKEGMYKNAGNSTSNNSYIFNTRLRKLKEFCEKHINIYVEEVIYPKEELDLYITQSWLNITKPGGFHHAHSHSNSIISGVFYVATTENDKIKFHDENVKLKERIKIELKEYNVWNSSSWSFPVEKNILLLFPSWLTHSVDENKNATEDRISISFNTFPKGTIGDKKSLTELIL